MPSRAELTSATAIALVSSTREGMAPLVAALERDPASTEARGRFYQLVRAHYIAGSVEREDAVPWKPTPAEQAVVAGWRQLGSEGWETLRRSDAALAAIPIEDPLGPDARWLRAAWRAQIGDAREDSATSALGVLTEMLLAAGNRPIATEWRSQTVALLRSLAIDPEWERWRGSLITEFGSDVLR